MKKVVRVIAVASLMSVNVFANQTSTIVKCEDLKKGHREYGCDAVKPSEIRNDKFQCLQAMQSFDFLQDEITAAKKEASRRTKPTFIPGRKAVVMGMAHGQLNISDSDKDYKVSVEKMKEAIAKKFSQGLEGSESVSLMVKTPKGEAKIKVNIEQNAQSSDFEVKSWEKDSSPEQDDDILMALGQNDINTSMGSEELASKVTENINSADEAIMKQKQDVEEEFNKKMQDIDNNEGLATLEKISFRRALRGKKERRLSQLDALLSKVPHYKAQVKEACGSQGLIVKSSSISGEVNSAGAPGPSSNIASR